jgi:hypothetical protein
LVPAKAQKRKGVEQQSIFADFFAPLRLCGNPFSSPYLKPTSYSLVSVIADKEGLTYNCRD